MGNFLWSCIANVICCQCNCFIFPSPTYNNQKWNEMVKFRRIKKGTFRNRDYKQINFIQLLSQSEQNYIIYFHGNAEDLTTCPPFLGPIVQATKATVYCLQYPTYGNYEANYLCSISEQIKRDAEDFFEYLQNIINRKKITIMGRSIGSGPAAYLAYSKNVQKLILISPFSTLQNVATDHVGCLGCCLRQDFNNEHYIRNFYGKLLIIHGIQDQVINFYHGAKLNDLYNQIGKKTGITFIKPKYMSHNIFNMEKDIIEPIDEFLFRSERIK